MTLPLGPEEHRDVWYANARLGVAVWSAWCWGSGCSPLGRWITCCSRVVEHSSLLGVCLLRFALSRLDLSGATDICIWSDVGRHFRANANLGTACEFFPAEFKADLHLNFGLGAHFKNVCDPHFMQLKKLRDNAASRTMLSDVPDMVEALTREHAESMLRGNISPPEEFHDYWPPPKKDVIHTKLSLKHLPCQISNCYSWSITRTDKKKRVNMRGIGERSHLLTGVKLTANLISGASRKCAANVMPTVADAGDDADDAEEDPLLDDAETPESVALGTKEWAGWRLSYRKQTPEKWTHEIFRARLLRTQKALGKAQPLGVEGCRSRSAAKLQTAALRTKANRKAKTEYVKAHVA